MESHSSEFYTELTVSLVSLSELQARLGPRLNLRSLGFPHITPGPGCTGSLSVNTTVGNNITTVGTTTTVVPSEEDDPPHKQSSISLPIHFHF